MEIWQINNRMGSLSKAGKVFLFIFLNIQDRIARLEIKYRPLLKSNFNAMIIKEETDEGNHLGGFNPPG